MTVVWKEVLSSNVARIAYQDDPPAMLVEFLPKGSHPATTYEYSGVDDKLFNEILKSPSVTTALNMQIKGKYSYRKIG